MIQVKDNGIFDIIYTIKTSYQNVFQRNFENQLCMHIIVF